MELDELTRPPALTAIDLFCGAGGLSEGLRQAGFQILAAADHDPDSCATYALNHPETPVIVGDLTKAANHRALLDAPRLRGRLSLLAGGPPCQAFSQIHNHDRVLDDPRNHLYREFIALLRRFTPCAFLLENVPGMAQLAAGEVRRQIEEDLSLRGRYQVVSAVLDAADFGAPQRRPRLVFVGTDSGLEPPRLPEGSGLAELLRGAGGRDLAAVGTEAASDLHGALMDAGNLTAVTAEQALSDLLEPGPAYTSDPASAYQAQARGGSPAPQDHVPSRIRPDTVTRLRAIPPGGNVHDLPDQLLARYLNGSKWGPAGNGERLSRRHFYAYRRLHPDKVAWTVNTKADFAYHYGDPRGLSVREAARLQGFPDSYHFVTAPPGTPGQYKNGARHSRYRQVGNAVPPPLARAVGVELAAALGGRAARERKLRAAA